jgi:uncharacterized protein YsxB (DUF464 family)
MIKVYVVQDGGQYQVTVIGHAEDEKVCAGVSSLYVALLETANKEGALAGHTEGADAKRAYIWRTKPMRRHMDMFRTGLEAMRREYPEYVQLST